MERRKLGATGLAAAVIGMGTWKTFDIRGRQSERARHRLVTEAVAGGIDLFDSSPMYGAAEKVLGAGLSGVRDRVLVATKVWSDDDIVAQRQIEAAFGFFGGRVDIYQVHNLVSASRRIDRLRALKEAGTVRAVGITHWREDSYDQMRRYLDRVDVIQVPYNPHQTRADEGLLDDATERGVGVLVMRPFGEGSLLRRLPGSRALGRLEEFGVTTWAQALLKWVLSDRRCHVALPATSNPDHLSENLVAGSPPWFGSEERDYVARLTR